MKKKLLLVVLGLLISLGSFAAEKIVVNTLIYKMQDLTASTHQRLDQNGRPCGLLKVITNDNTMTFEGSVVGDVEYKNGEYWVYLTEGTYLLKIKASEKDPLLLDFKNYNLQKVESKGTYELTFFMQEYDVLDMKEHKIIEGPKLKKYAISILTLPYGWTIKGCSTLDYLKRLSQIIARDGDGWGTKYDCTILAYYEDDDIYYYRLIIESTDDEIDAVLGKFVGHGGFEEKIFIVED